MIYFYGSPLKNLRRRKLDIVYDTKREALKSSIFYFLASLDAMHASIVQPLVLFFIFDEIIVLKKLFLICLLYCQLPAAKCQVNYFQQQVNYKIDVTLNDVDNTLMALK